MIAVFKQKSPGNVVILLLFGLLLKLPIFLYPRNILSTDNDGQLYRWFLASLPPGNTVLFSFISFGLLYVQALLLNYLMNEYRMMTRQNYLPAMAFLLVTSLMPEWNYLSAPMLANTFIICLFIYLFRLYNSATAKAQVFNIGLLAGISSYIYFPSVAFMLCIILGLMILKPFRINEIVLFLIGCLTPYYFYGAYLFLVNKLSWQSFLPHLSVRVPAIRNTIWLAISTLLLTVPFLMGGYYVQTHLRKMLIQVRKNWSIVLLYLLLAFFVPFLNSDQSFFTWVLITTPFAAFHACAYLYSAKWVSLLLFFLTISYILFQQYGHPSTWH